MSTQSFVTYVTLYILRLQKAGRTTLLAIGLWFIHSIFIDAEGRACSGNGPRCDMCHVGMIHTITCFMTNVVVVVEAIEFMLR